MSRPNRATAKMAKILWELSKSNKVNLDEIKKDFTYTNQTDKEFAINAATWRKYITSKFIPHLRFTKDMLKKIINLDYIDKLMPERRFDQTLYYILKDTY
jgi:hypothetical protein